MEIEQLVWVSDGESIQSTGNEMKPLVRVYVLSDVVGQRLQRHVVEGQVGQGPELSETIWQPERERGGAGTILIPNIFF